MFTILSLFPVIAWNTCECQVCLFIFFLRPLHEYTKHTKLHFLEYFLHCILHQRIFLLDIEWELFKCLFWKANNSIVKFMISIRSDVSFWYRSKVMLNYDNVNNSKKLCKYRSRFFFIVEQMQVFLPSTNLVGEEKNLSENFNWIK